MTKKMKYETPEIEITSFAIERRIMGETDMNGDVTKYQGLSDELVTKDSLEDLFN